MNITLLTNEMLNAFAQHLRQEEKSEATIQKYIRDVNRFAEFARGQEVTKEVVIRYKHELLASGYAPRSINSMLASINSLFLFLGWHGFRVKSVKVQVQTFCQEEKELTKSEYQRLCRTAEKKRNGRLSLILQTICCTGIRVSELAFITVDAVKCGVAVVRCKAKTRKIFLVSGLRKKLLRYIAQEKISYGAVFITKTGKAVNRTNIWREMKGLCADAGIDPKKVFPHNLRHLFARVFYNQEKDIVRLADILGHSSINTTRIYIVSTGLEHRKLIEKMQLIL